MSLILTNKAPLLETMYPAHRILSHEGFDPRTDGTPDNIIWLVDTVADYITYVEKATIYSACKNRIALNFVDWSWQQHNPVETGFFHKCIDLALPNNSDGLMWGYPNLTVGGGYYPNVLAHVTSPSAASILWMLKELDKQHKTLKVSLSFVSFEKVPLEIQYDKLQFGSPLILVEPTHSTFVEVAKNNSPIVAILTRTPTVYSKMFERNEQRIISVVDTFKRMITTNYDEDEAESPKWAQTDFAWYPYTFSEATISQLATVMSDEQDASSDLILRPEVKINTVFNHINWLLK